jgi:single-strand DNA-binding protein
MRPRFTVYGSPGHGAGADGARDQVELHPPAVGAGGAGPGSNKTGRSPRVFGQPGDRVELRFTANGAAVANFRLAVTPRVRQGDQWTDGETSFFRINCWRQLAENVTETLGKGARAIVIGRLRLRSWETDEGERRSVVEVEADEVAPSLKFATATIQRTSAKAAASASKGGQFTDEPPF